MTEIIIHIVSFGGVLSLLSSIVLLGSWMIDPRVWGADVGAGPENQNRVGGSVTVAILLVAQVSAMVFATRRLELIVGELRFWTAFAVNYAYYQVFNLFDLLIIDWLIYLKIKPRFMRPDYLPVADRFSKHAIDFRNGLVIGILPAAVSSGLWALVIR